MSIPETTSVEGFERYVGGKCLFHSTGEAWRDIKAWIVALPAVVDTLHLPSVSEPYVAWTMNVSDAAIIEPTDVLVTVTRACICGSDLWPYKTMEHSDTGRVMGHEAIGVVE